MAGPGNSLNITQSGLVTFDGVSIFNGRTLTAGTGISITNGNGVAGNPIISSSGLITILGDTGSISGSTVTIFSNNAVTQAGASVRFVNSGTVSTLQLTNPTTFNTFLGLNSGNLTLNPAMALQNTFTGYRAGVGLTTGGNNEGYGVSSLRSLTTGVNNVGIGFFSLQTVTTGSNNTAIGNQAGQFLTGSDSQNILIAHPGVLGDNAVIRIGAPAAQTTCYVAGIASVTTSNSQMVTIDTTTGQMGSAAIPGGSAVGFYAYANANIANVTGNSVTYTVQFNSTTRNNGTSFNTATGVFTAPTTGLYHFSCTIGLIATTAFSGTSVLIGYKGSVQSQRLYQVAIAAVAAGSTIILPSSWEVQMTAGDTMAVQAFSDSALQDINLIGGAIAAGAFNANSSFSGYFVGA